MLVMEHTLPSYSKTWTAFSNTWSEFSKTCSAFSIQITLFRPPLAVSSSNSSHMCCWINKLNVYIILERNLLHEDV